MESANLAPLTLVSYSVAVLRSEPAIVRAVATQSVKLMLMMLASRLRPVSVIVRTELPALASSSVQASRLQPQKELVSLTWWQPPPPHRPDPMSLAEVTADLLLRRRRAVAAARPAVPAPAPSQPLHRSFTAG